MFKTVREIKTFFVGLGLTEHEFQRLVIVFIKGVLFTAMATFLMLVAAILF